MQIEECDVRPLHSGNHDDNYDATTLVYYPIGCCCVARKIVRCLALYLRNVSELNVYPTFYKPPPLQCNARIYYYSRGYENL